MNKLIYKMVEAAEITWHQVEVAEYKMGCSLEIAQNLLTNDMIQEPKDYLLSILDDIERAMDDGYSPSAGWTHERVAEYTTFIIDLLDLLPSTPKQKPFKDGSHVWMEDPRVYARKLQAQGFSFGDFRNQWAHLSESEWGMEVKKHLGEQA